MATTLHYILIGSGDTSPTAAQIVAGVSYTGATVHAAGDVPYTSAGTYDFDSDPATGLTPGTTYTLWAVSYDGSNYGTPISGSVTTADEYAASGGLAAQAATVAGSASHLTLHAASGALEAQAATVAGTANRVVVHGSTGALEAQAATVSGSADHSSAGAFSATGALSAQAATVAGSAAHLTLHTSTGALVADPASVSGVSIHTGDGAEVVQPRTGAGRPSRRQRVVVEIDGEDFIAESVEEAQALLDQAKEAAEEKAQIAVKRAIEAKKRPVRKVLADARKTLELPTIKALGLDGYAEEISKQIEDIYQSAIQTIEVAALLRNRERAEEDDEDILMLL